jgi:ATP-dependent DNA ligase
VPDGKTVFLVVDGATMLKSACKMGLEGVVSKVRDARYNPVGSTNG